MTFLSEDETFCTESSFIKEKNNVVLTKHLAVSCHQIPGEFVTESVQMSTVLAKECTFEAVNVDEHQAELMRDAITNRLTSPLVPQGIPEKDQLNLMQAVELADIVHCAQKQDVFMVRESIVAVVE